MKCSQQYRPSAGVREPASVRRRGPITLFSTACVPLPCDAARAAVWKDAGLSARSTCLTEDIHSDVFRNSDELPKTSAGSFSTAPLFNVSFVLEINGSIMHLDRVRQKKNKKTTMFRLLESAMEQGNIKRATSVLTLKGFCQAGCD